MGLFRRPSGASGAASGTAAQAAGAVPATPAAAAPANPDAPKAANAAPRVALGFPDHFPTPPLGFTAPRGAAGSPLNEAALRELSERVASLTHHVEEERSARKGVEDKLGAVEDRMRFLQNVSEVISIQYNPFLSGEEAEVFEGLRPQAPPPAAGAPTNGHAMPAPPVAVPPREPEAGPARAPAVEPEAEPGTGAAAQDALEALVKAEGLGTAPLLRAPEPALAPVREVVAVETAPEAEEAGPAPGPARGGESAPPPAMEWEEGAPPPDACYLAMAWFDYLLERLEPGAILDLLGFYRDVGWVPERAHGWLGRLARGVMPTRAKRKGLRGSLAPPDARELVRIHMASLRFLTHLFGRGEDRARFAGLPAAVKRLAEGG